MTWTGPAWSAGGTLPASKFWQAIATDGKGVWIAVANGLFSGSAAITMVSTNNGATWSLGGTPPGSSSESWCALATDGAGHWVCISNSSTACMVSSNNGATWTSGGALAAAGGGSTAYQQLVTDGAGHWVATMEGNMYTSVSSNNGASWSAGGNTPTSVGFSSMTTDGLGNWIGVALSSAASAISTNNGTSWTAAGAPPATMSKVATDKLGNWVAIGTSATASSCLSVNNGATWTTTGVMPKSSGFFPNWVALLVDGKGNWVAVADGDPISGGGTPASISTNAATSWVHGPNSTTCAENIGCAARDLAGNYIALPGGSGGSDSTISFGPPAVAGQASFVQWGDSAGSHGSGSTYNVLPANCGIGTCVAVALVSTTGGLNDVSTVTSGMGTFVRVTSNDGSGLGDDEWWVCLKTTGAAQSITVTTTSGSSSFAQASEWTTPLGFGSATGLGAGHGSGPQNPSQTFTPPQPNCAVLAFGDLNSLTGGPTGAWNTYSGGFFAVADGFLVAYTIPPSTTAVTAQFSTSSSSTWQITGLALNPNLPPAPPAPVLGFSPVAVTRSHVR